jgi:hypothetical protein
MGKKDILPTQIFIEPELLIYIDSLAVDTVELDAQLYLQSFY